MGKYMKKSKLTGGIAVMEVSPQSSPGLRTRAAKTRALQRLNKSFSQSAAVSSPRAAASSSSYLQLRNRRLEKPPVFRQLHKAQQDGECCEDGLSRECSSNDSRLKRDLADSGSEKRKLRVETGSGNARDFEDYFGENCPDFGGDNRGTAEKIHSSLVRDLRTNKTSYSTRMETNSHTTNSGVEMELLKSIPTANDIEEFFAQEELWHQTTFIQKYNFDFASEMPLQGRYEWVQVVP
ncbi:cyclin-dependent kinase inhibitor 3-like [Cucurbita moschata]|uniref:Cyclin-dependent kinase inhibitor 3-like n=1 Tax=Cucurbita moschata TaxID=3662 RepID=A0A6J1ETD6_CUCMO|nr:cyclin-dependent kinase inhibitor 3-like [Cucurbita moschata]